MSLPINVRHLQEKDLEVEGELSAAELALDATDELVHVRQPLHYELRAQQVGQDVLVTGRLELVLDCECARCLKPFEFRLEIPEWSVHVPLQGPDQVVLKDDAVDLTPFVREDILLEFPQHPLCNSDCAGLPNRTKAATVPKTGSSQAPNASAWAELNKLKF